MTVAGLIVAGGAGERMRRSGGLLPKPLVPIRGVSLLERNLLALRRAGLTDLHVAVSAGADGVGEFARSRGREVARALGASLSVITEPRPLGSIGAAAYLGDRTEVVVVNADNLTSLDLQAMLAAHRASGAALTLAVHDQPFPIPFGEVVAQGDRVVAYREKPDLMVQVCSAVSVLGAEALAAFDPGETVGLPAFANRLLTRGCDVRMYRHSAPWIDVNDVAAAERASALVGAHPDQLELWATRLDDQNVAMLLHGSRGVMLETRNDGVWCLPLAPVAAGDELMSPAKLLATRYGIESARLKPLAVFDEIDIASCRITRAHVLSANVVDPAPVEPATWVPVQDIPKLDRVAPLVARAIAAMAELSPKGGSA